MKKTLSVLDMCSSDDIKYIKKLIKGHNSKLTFEKVKTILLETAFDKKFKDGFKIVFDEGLIIKWDDHSEEIESSWKQIN